ncbi:Type I secretion system ATP-binding protein PrsD [Hartmannibacter diazotrophicus]|uniref:Type I secretion system ATP-binding protein PrsD n=1 Tax=Hartmannibacter diazotrophicus TaxID=1482074 RepID=A0A2C9DDV9_9HYPH|nr:ATP-binding cassette domain-containing protein [Hartmannibacter diazotrophicus]SON58360.1 Type I secretion system ATP-binding protein PrsD [Hartmannibacter diazotrophicus]
MRTVRFLFGLLSQAEGGIAALLFVSFFTNILFLVSPFYLMHVYDSVIAAHSLVNLFAISAIALVLYMALFGFDALRMRMLARAAPEIERSFDRYARAIVHRDRMQGETFWSVANALDRLEQVVLSPAITALIDLPFAPLFLIVAFAIHPLIGAAGLVGVVVLVGTTIHFGRKGNALNGDHLQAARSQAVFGNSVLTQQDYIQTSRARDFILSKWMEARGESHRRQFQGAKVSSFGIVLARTLRLLLQSSVLGAGAWLVLHQSLSAGAIMAASVVVSRAVMPMEQAAAMQGMLQSAIAAQNALDEAETKSAREAGERAVPIFMDDLKPSVIARNLIFQYPEATGPVLRNINLRVAAGTVCVVTGPVGCGKSTLLKCILGLLQPQGGHVSLGDVIVTPSTVERIAQSIGYLPQQAHIFPISIAQNIALSDGPDRVERAVAAARAAGCDAAINSLRDGYHTIPFNERGCILSPGLVQGLALARLFAARPRIVLLDEPTQSLDQTGIDHLRAQIEALKAEGAAIVMVTHDPQFVRSSDQLLMFHPVAGPLFGPTNDILSRLAAIETQRSPNPAAQGRA